MIRRSSVVLAVLLVISCVGVMGETMDTTGNGMGSGADGVNDLVAGNSDFAFDLYGRLKDDKQVMKDGGNLFFSPYSISTALAMTWAGARGDTESQMAEVLHFGFGQEKLHPLFGSLEKYFNEASKKGDYELNVANSLWGQKGFRFLENFLELTKSSYGAGLSEVDFAMEEKARKTINTWVEKRTNDKIKELIVKGILDGNTKLVLTNAIYFKGDWITKFDKKNTKKTGFKVSPDKTVETDMMYMKDKFKFFEDEDVKVIDLPYKGDDLSMMVVLPNAADGLGEIEKQFSAEKVKKWNESLRKREVMLFLPKFKITWGTFELSKILQEMGIKDAFDDRFADFSGMEPGRGLFISNVLHKAFVAVDEEGTEAAAATAVIMKERAMPAMPVFRADHPFIFMIRDNQTGSILFIGRMMNPAITGE